MNYVKGAGKHSQGNEEHWGADTKGEKASKAWLIKIHFSAF